MWRCQIHEPDCFPAGLTYAGGEVSNQGNSLLGLPLGDAQGLDSRVVDHPGSISNLPPSNLIAWRRAIADLEAVCLRRVA